MNVTNRNEILSKNKNLYKRLKVAHNAPTGRDGTGRDVGVGFLCLSLKF